MVLLPEDTNVCFNTALLLEVVADTGFGDGFVDTDEYDGTVAIARAAMDDIMIASRLSLLILFPPDLLLVLLALIPVPSLLSLGSLWL